MLFFSLFKKKKPNKVSKIDKEMENNNDLIKKNEVAIKGLTIHEDLKDLIWIADGKYKNYFNDNKNQYSFELNDSKITVSFLNQEEPSLIYTNQKILQPPNISTIPRPPYFPTYAGLTPQQKWIYLNLLLNPYNNDFDIGYVFILYYGLERHLLSGNFEKAINVIIKLRDVHFNKSFQAYSANAIILSCMVHKRGDLVLKFLQSLDKDYELEFSDNLFLICYFSFDIPLLPNDIMRMAKTFEFTNLNYIKKYPELFLETLTLIIEKELGEKSIDLKKYLTNNEISKLKKQEVHIFANVSIFDKTIPVPQLSNNFKLKNAIYNFLQSAHNQVKLKLAGMRKSGEKPISSQKTEKKEKVITFNAKKEKELLKELSSNKRDLLNRHFSYIQLYDFYYKYRELGEYYLNKCMDYCILDINSLAEMNEAYINSKLKQAKEFPSLYSKAEKQEIKKTGFNGNIPAFKRLAIIYEKKEDYQKAIEICNKAIDYGQSIEDFQKRKAEMINKLENTKKGNQ